MADVPGYRDCKLLVRNARNAVFAAEREHDRRPVRLKVFQAGQAERARVEHALLRRAAGPGVIESLALDLAGDQPLLVLAAPRGIRLGALAATRPPLVRLLRAVEAACAALASLHAHGIVHRDVRPDTFVVDTDTDVGCIVDLDCAIDAAALFARAAGDVVGSPAYIAPEQTGRIQHRVDSRSDLYAFGATLFELLTSRPPFSGATIDELLRAHVATAPPSPAAVTPSVPAPIARIVLKLLQKQPEDRYQSAAALAADMAECRRQLEATGVIADFPLGQSDAPQRLVFPRKLVGRDAELSVVVRVLDRVANGATCEALYIRGLSGMGKTALCEGLRALVATRGGYFAAGKFDAHRSDHPDVGIRAALDALVQQWLTEDDTRLAERRASLRAELGTIARALMELVPDLPLVLGDDLPDTPVLGPREARSRLRLAVERFVWATAASAPPLVLVFDDVQWADPASLDVIASVLSSHRMRSLLVVATCRSDTEADARVLEGFRLRLAETRVPQHVIDLPPLSEAAVASLLAAALGRSLDDTRALARLVAVKTGSVPLLIEQFASHLHAIGALRVVPGRGFDWDDDAIRAAHIPDGAAALMVAKLQMLDAGARDVLRLASCVAHELSVHALCARAERDHGAVAGALARLCDAGLIVPARTGYRFAHDRIREAAQALATVSERAQMHAEAARLLLDGTPATELPSRALEIADHIALGNGLLAPSVDARALEVAYMAASGALRSGASEAAFRHMAAAYARLDESEWSRNPGGAFQLAMQYVDCAYQSHAFVRACEVVAQLEQRPLMELQRAMVASKRLMLMAIDSDGSLSALRQTLDMIAAFGVRLPENPSRLRQLVELVRTDLALRRCLGPGGFRAADPGDTAWLPPIVVLSAASIMLAWMRPSLMSLVSAYCLRAYARHGHRGSPALALAGYAASRRVWMPFSRRTERYAAAAEAWCRDAPHPLYTHRARYTLYAMLYAWTRPRRDLLDAVRQIGEQATELGDLGYASLAASQYALYTALVGSPLDAAEAACERLLDRAPRSGYASLTEAIRMLRTGRGDAGLPRFSMPSIDALTGVRGRMRPPSPFLATALCVLGEHAEVVRHGADYPIAKLTRVCPFPYVADYLFAYGISVSALASATRAPRSLRRTIRACMRQLRAYARPGADFEHMWLGLHAEHARLCGRAATAYRRYAAAAALARRQGYRHHAALLHERHADLLAARRRHTEATSLRRRALALYGEWGATAKVQALTALVD
jgi:hypothetical protein